MEFDALVAMLMSNKISHRIEWNLYYQIVSVIDSSDFSKMADFYFDASDGHLCKMTIDEDKYLRR